MMSGIRSKDTKPELIIRRGLHRMGYRYRLHDRKLAGTPDLVLPKYKTVIFVHGCFWHGHSCHLFKWPKSRIDFWREKIERNKRKDGEALEALKVDWRVLIVWECALKGRFRQPAESLLSEIAHFLCSNERVAELRGTNYGSS